MQSEHFTINSHIKLDTHTPGDSQTEKGQLFDESHQENKGNVPTIPDYSKLLEKFNQYREKILNDTSLERALKLYVEVRASTEAEVHHNKTGDDDSNFFELAFDVRKNFLDSEDPKVTFG